MAQMFSRDASPHATLPKPWEEDHTFHDVLYDWMERAPWLAVSAAAHLLAFFVFQSIPWGAFVREEPPVVHTTIERVAEETLEEEEELVEPEVSEAPIDEPELQTDELADVAQDDPSEADLAEGEPEALALAPFEASSTNNPLGIGPGGGGKYGQRFGDRGRRKVGTGTEVALLAALEWLAAHQDEDGSWDADGFEAHCPAGGECGDPGHATHDVGLTGLALLAFLGDGHTTNQGAYRDVVARGVQWLKSSQDRDTGLFGNDASHDFVYDHAIATLAICEAYHFSKSPTLKGSAQKAVGYIQRARNPYGAWRYAVPPDGDDDTSITGWMVFALASGKEAGLEVDEAALEGALAWIDRATDPATGRVGYDQPGSLSSRTPANEHFPREKGEAMTAVGLLCRFFLGQDPADTPLMEKHADLLLRTLPEWDPDGFGCDMYYWYYGSYAMFQMGGRKYWEPWNKAMKEAVLDSQRKDAHAQGSWDPVGPWGYSGGRVYATATMALCLEVYFRYGRVLGAR